jgi:hypothetical protein
VALSDRNPLALTSDREGIRVETNYVEFPALGALLGVLSEYIEHSRHFALDRIPVVLVLVKLNYHWPVARVDDEIEPRELFVPFAAETHVNLTIEFPPRGG